MFRQSLRIAAAGAILAGTALGSVFISTAVASATSTAPTVTCTGFTATTKGAGTLSKCTPTTNTSGGGKAVANISKSTAVITWGDGKGTTTEKFTENGVTPTKCPSKESEIKEVSTVTGGTGKSTLTIKKGQVATAYLCLNTAKGTVSLLPGTKYSV
jgi:hypothetical protein